MKVRRHKLSLPDGNRIRQIGVATSQPILRFSGVGAFEVNHLMRSVNASVGSPGTVQSYRCIGDARYRALKCGLNGVRFTATLQLPAVKAAAVVFDCQRYSLRRFLVCIRHETSA